MKGEDLKLGSVILFKTSKWERKGVIASNNKCTAYSPVFQVVPIVNEATANCAELSNGQFLDFTNELLLDRNNVTRKLGFLNKEEFNNLRNGLKFQHGMGDYSKPDQPIKRGDIFMVRLPKIHNSSIQSGFRPVIIVTNNSLMDGDKILVVPCTTQVKNQLPTHFKLQLKEETTVLCEAEMAVRKSQLEMKVGSLGEKGLMKLDECIRIQHGL